MKEAKGVGKIYDKNPHFEKQRTKKVISYHYFVIVKKIFCLTKIVFL